MILHPKPFAEAAAVAERKGLLPTNLSSRKLSQLSAELRRRAVFSARMDRAEVLQVLKNEVSDIAGGELRGIPEAKARLADVLKQIGYAAPEKLAGTLRDHSSHSRRALMIETSVLDCLGYGRHLAAQSPEMLAAAPAQELVRMIEPTGARRDWTARWKAAAAESGGFDGATNPDVSGGRMVAIKNHPIWQALGDGAGGYKDTLGNPWAPFAFSSGMNTVDVERSDAVSLGLLAENDVVAPDTSTTLNENLEVSADRFDAFLRSALEQDSALSLEDGVLSLSNRAAPAAHILRTRLDQALRERSAA